MSSAVGALASPKEMGFEKNGTLMAGEGDSGSRRQRGHGDEEGTLSRQMSEVSLCATEDEDEDDDGKGAEDLDLGPRISIKDQLERDKDDESLRKWKEQLLGNFDLNSVGESLEPDVKILSFSIISPGRPDIVLPLPTAPDSKGVLFTLKESCHYKLRFSFSVNNNIVSGLRYTNTVWKTGVKVDRTREMLGTFSPQLDPYTYETPEETTPSGMFARGSYAAKTKFIDDDGKCYLEMNYTFEIRRDWASTD